MIISDLRQTLIKEVQNAPGGSNRPLLRRQRANNENQSNASFAAYAFHRFRTLLEESDIYSKLRIEEITLVLAHVHTQLKDQQLTQTKTNPEKNPENQENNHDENSKNKNNDTPHSKSEEIKQPINKLLTGILEKLPNELNSPKNADIAFSKHIRYSYNAIKGRRRTMEDTHICLPNFNSIFKLNTNSNLHLFAVFDGHGGHLAAEFCHIEYPLILADYFLSNTSSTIDFEDILKKSVVELNEQFLEKCKSSLSGATASIILYDSSLQKLHSVWVGDSEACLIYPKKSKSSIALVKPHKLTDPEEVERIEAAGGKVVTYSGVNSVPRLNGTLAIARSIGDRDEIENGLACLPSYICENIETKFSAQLIIACDGLWDVCEPDECDTVLKIGGLEDWDDSEFSVKAARVLVSHAFNNMSTDNISVIVVDVSPVANASKNEESGSTEAISFQVSGTSTELKGGVSEEIHNKVLDSKSLSSKVNPVEFSRQSPMPINPLKAVHMKPAENSTCVGMSIQGTQIKPETKEVFVNSQVAKIVKSHGN